MSNRGSQSPRPCHFSILCLLTTQLLAVVPSDLQTILSMFLVRGLKNPSTLAIDIPTYSSGAILGATFGRPVRFGFSKT